ncbi:glutathione S-transferase N-terminal domain-containing protein [Hephaestia sp. GCM10023244]|uniref:glutathione S-transferase N-terminal domain-containing protein n=1 Tax=unclassified Hephaestia TaxID=2631281 RepID=UPI0020770F5B|nr:glutathione S-transferase N-terminal domain-containing protein [Hephaestia sp. MAHUQ-44]MCM8730857.1 glutathione S-transferase N-terminal domain-containing protein [Hephaestia sp. MAHUQ-44]
MKLYYAPGACSLADHIALHEAGLSFEHERVDLKTKITAHGADYRAITPKGYVPALAFDGGPVLTENIAILYWIAEQTPALMPEGPLGRARLLEAMAYISSEIHKSFKPFFQRRGEDETRPAGDAITRQFTLLAETMKGDYLFGAFSVADPFLFVMLRWAFAFGIEVPEPLVAYFERIKARPAVARAMAEEGIA